MEVSDFCTVKQVAQAKSVTEAAVYSAIRSGRLASVELFGKILVPRAEADAWEPVKDLADRGRMGGSVPRVPRDERG